ncbi:MAG: VWA domain-containing protein [Proteobacteria bacterium]|nr:VWA domain-containing protein [Pseudomonadota bacterium]
MKRSFITTLAFLFVVGICVECENSGESGKKGDEDPSDIDTDTDSDTDGDTDGDTDTDTDTDSDIDTDTDTDSDSDGDSDTDADSDVDTGCVDKDSDKWCAEYDCNDTDSAVNPNADEVADNDIDDDCDSLTDEESDTEVLCGEGKFEINVVPVHIMILQDVSGSMKDVKDGETTSKWDQAKAALDSMLTNSANDEIKFGFDSFSNDGSCGVDQPVKYDCGTVDAATLATSIQGLPVPAGATPLCSAIKRFNTNLFPNYAINFASKDADSYLLIVSDGDDTCGGDNNCGDGEASAQNLGDATAEVFADDIKTYIIGFGMDTSAQLDAIAQAGGTGRDSFIPASNQQELQDALDAIVASVTTCKYDVDHPDGADLDKVNFYFDDVGIIYNEDCSNPAVANDEGWTWVDQTTKDAVRFCDGTCDKLENDTDVKVEFGCPPYVP